MIRKYIKKNYTTYFFFYISFSGNIATFATESRRCEKYHQIFSQKSAASDANPHQFVGK